MISGPFQAVWRRADRRTTQSWSTLLPGLISLFLILSILSFFTEFAQPFSLRYLAIKNYTNQNGSLGAAGIIIQAGLLMGTILLAARRWRLPGGTITLILGVNALLMAVLDDGYMLVPAAVVVGVVADLLYWKWQPSIRRLEAWRAFAFLVPLIYYLGYFLSLLLYYQSITWTLHLWLGSTIVASVAGLLLSYLLVPPQFPTEAEE